MFFEQHKTFTQILIQLRPRCIYLFFCFFCMSIIHRYYILWLYALQVTISVLHVFKFPYINIYIRKCLFVFIQSLPLTKHYKRTFLLLFVRRKLNGIQITGFFVLIHRIHYSPQNSRRSRKEYLKPKCVAIIFVITDVPLTLLFCYVRQEAIFRRN